MSPEERKYFEDFRVKIKLHLDRLRGIESEILLDERQFYAYLGRNEPKITENALSRLLMMDKICNDKFDEN